MNCDLKFDYEEALKRHNLKQSQIDELRESAKNFPIIPKCLTDKQVDHLFLKVVDLRN